MAAKMGVTGGQANLHHATSRQQRRRGQPPRAGCSKSHQLRAARMGLFIEGAPSFLIAVRVLEEVRWDFDSGLMRW